MNPRTVLAIILLTFATACREKAGETKANSPSPELKGTVLFLGDSITHAGHYISHIEAVARAMGDTESEFINLGLPSETCTGLSEPDHPFPRPNVQDRIDRALQVIQPDLVFACYGMNDGIYYPFDEERFEAYQRGIDTIIDKVHTSGAKLILLTPPPFDPEPLRAEGKIKPAGAEKYAWFEIYENYDTEVLSKYSDWILEQRERVEGVIDLRTPVLNYLIHRRETQPGFTLSPDGVHLNEEGHAILSTAILDAFGIEPALVDPDNTADIDATEKRQRILHDAWLTHVGHTRPGVRPGLPLGIARIAAELSASENPVRLFNGTNLSGWKGDPSIWSVENGAILGRNADPVPSSTYLFTEKTYRNFRLLFDVKQTVSPEHSPMHSAVAALGEQITDEGDNKFGFKGPLLMCCHDWGIWDAHGRNRIEPASQKGALKIAAENVGDWNRCEILVIGNRIRFVANGSLVFDFTDNPEMLRTSPLGLQIHKNQKPQEFRFRGLVLCDDPEDLLATLTSK